MLLNRRCHACDARRFGLDFRTLLRGAQCLCFCRELSHHLGLVRLLAKRLGFARAALRLASLEDGSESSLLRLPLEPHLLLELLLALQPVCLLGGFTCFRSLRGALNSNQQ